MSKKIAAFTVTVSVLSLLVGDPCHCVAQVAAPEVAAPATQTASSAAVLEPGTLRQQHWLKATLQERILVAESLSVPHPVFHTHVSGNSSARPAVMVEILDDSESYFTTAELYLAVQSSRFPATTQVLLPINVGEFSGFRSRFVQLPFEVEPSDILAFNLLDDDRLTKEEEKTLLKGCQGAGYCVVVAGCVYCPEAAALIQPVATTAAEILGEVIIQDCASHKFDNFGIAEYIVPSQIPYEPQQANKLAVLDSGNTARVVLRLYSPPNQLDITSPVTQGK